MGDHNELGKSITNIVRKLAAASKLRFVCPQEGNKAFKTSFGFKHPPRPPPLLFVLIALNISEVEDRLDIDKAKGLETGKRQFPNKNGSFE